MLLAIDIGNSAVKCAVFDGARIHLDFRIPHDQLADAEVLHTLIAGTGDVALHRVAICSVVPEAGQTIREMLATMRDTPVTWITHTCRLPLRLGYARPDQLGVDRIAAAAGAIRVAAEHSASKAVPVVAIDAGTAVTFNVIDAERVFRGGLIWAGPDLVLAALGRFTAQLPIVEPRLPVDLLANETVGALRSGAMLGFIEGTRGILNRLATALGAQPYVVVTGGRGGLLADALEEVSHHDPHLVLRGVREIAEMNPGRTSPSPTLS